MKEQDKNRMDLIATELADKLRDYFFDSLSDYMEKEERLDFVMSLTLSSQISCLLNCLYEIVGEHEDEIKKIDQIKDMFMKGVPGILSGHTMITKDYLYDNKNMQ